MGVTNRTARRVLATYRAAFNLNVQAGDGLELLGITGRTVTLRELVISKPSAAVVVGVVKRGTADTGGTSSLLTVVPVDDVLTAGSASVKAYTVAPSAGAAYGTVAFWSMATTDTLVMNVNPDQVMPIALHTTGESLGINFSGTATVIGSVEWTEE